MERREGHATSASTIHRLPSQVVVVGLMLTLLLLQGTFVTAPRARADVQTSTFCLGASGPWTIYPGQDVFASDETLATLFESDLTKFNTEGTGVVNNYSASVDWGDGSTGTGSISFVGSGVSWTCGNTSSNSFLEMTIHASHQYSSLGTFTVTVTVTDTSNSANYATTTITVKVIDAQIQAFGDSIFTPSGSGDVNGTVATFTDPDTSATASEYSAFIDWGDGTPGDAGTITGSNGSFSVAGSHTYTDLSDHNICVQITDVDDSSNSAFTCGSRFDPGIVVTGGYSFTGTEPAAFNGTVATFTDPDPSAVATDYSASIDWGDGSAVGAGTITGSNGSFTVTGAHKYYSGSHTMTVTVTDVDLPTMSVSATDSVTVTGDAAITASGTLPLLESGSSVSGFVASFVDPNPGATASEYSASIDWGDGSSSTGTIGSGTVGNTGVGFEISGSHTYAAAGPYTITTTVTDLDNASNTATAVNRAEPAITGTGAFTLNGIAGQTTSGTVATFTDPDTTETASDYLASIDWGDGSVLDYGTPITGSAGSFTVTGSHTYASKGSYTVTVFIGDEDPVGPFEGNSVQVTDTATILAPSTTTTTVFDPGLQAAWTGDEVAGATALDTASVQPWNNPAPEGTVRYTFFTNGGCSGQGSDAGAVSMTPLDLSIDSPNVVPNSNVEGPLAVGDYSFKAVYSGDSNYGGSSGPCEPFTVNKATPTITSTPGGTVKLGSGAKLSDSATLSGGYHPSGSITFTLYDPTGALVYTDIVPVSGAGTYTTSSGNNPGGYLPTLAGGYQWITSYSGDANNNAVATQMGDEPEGVSGVADLAVYVAGAPSPDSFPKPVTFTITVKNYGPNAAGVYLSDTLPSSSGLVSFTISQGTCNAPPLGSTGTMTCSIGTLANGATATIKVTVKPNSKKMTLSDMASVWSDAYITDPTSANNTATSNVQVK